MTRLDRAIPLSSLVDTLPDNPLRALYQHAAKPGMLNLASGHPSCDAYDFEGLEQASRQASRETMAWSYGASAGDPDLLEILKAFSPDRPTNHQIIVTSGAQQAVDLSLRCLAAPGSFVAVPEPIYPAILSICAAAGLRAVPYKISAKDPDMTNLQQLFEKKWIQAIYALPTFANPSGETWPRSMRTRFLKLCADHNIPVIEDDPYRQLSFEGAAPATLLELSKDIKDSFVLHAASLSKIVAPGLRLGWALVPKPVAKPMTILRQAADLQPNALAQRVAVHYMRSFRLNTHLAHVRNLYRQRSERLYQTLAPAGFQMSLPQGGMFLWASCPKEIKCSELFERAISNNVLFAPGEAFAASRTSSYLQNNLRLCFSGLDADSLELAALRLIAAMEA